MKRIIGLCCLFVTIHLFAELPSVIALPQESTAVEQTAAKELSSYLEQITGRKFEIVKEGERPGTGAFLVGATSKAKEMFPSFQRDAIALVRTGKDIVVTGHSTRGVLYAVYSLLEDYAGVRWYTPDATVVPKNPDLDFPNLNLTYAPPLIMRETNCASTYEIPFAVQMKVNGHFPKIPAEYGGHEAIIGFCHTFGQFLPASKYFEEHPNWYAMNNGQRVATGKYQLCLTNEEMTQEMIRVCLEKLKENPDCHVISVSQNDGGTPCQCDACKAVEEEEGGTAAGPLIRFVNKVAAAIEREYPDVLVDTLAYTFTCKAPTKTRPARNVVIRYCDIEADFSRPINSNQNGAIRDDVTAWAKIAPNLYNWHYVANFQNIMLPHPSFQNYQDDIRFYVKNKSVGMFMEGAVCYLSDFEVMRCWVLTHLMWNPSLDQDKLMQDFLNGYYGMAAPHLKSYLELIKTTFQRTDLPLSCFRCWVTDWMTRDVTEKAIAIFNKAEKAVAQDATLLERVKKARLSLDLVCFFWYPTLKKEGTLAEFPIKDWEERADYFCDCVQKNFTWRNYLVFMMMSSYNKSFSLMVRDNPPVPSYCKGLSQKSWIDAQEYLFGIAGIGTAVTIVDDALASNGKAARMQNTASWCIQMPLPAHLPKGERWRVCVNARFEGKDTSKGVAIFGIYDQSKHKEIFRKAITASEMKAEAYTPIFVGPFPSSSSLYIYCDPNGSPGDLYLLVDNITLLRE